MLKAVYNRNSKKKNNDSVNVIRSRLKNLKEENKKMYKDEIKIERPDYIVDIVEKVLRFNNKN